MPHRDMLHRLSQCVLSALREFVYPPLCTVCAEPLGEDPWLCEGCLAKLRRNHETRDPCPRCGENRRIRECTCHLVWDHPFECVYSLFDFDDTVQGIAHHLKYKGRSRLGHHVARTHAGLVPADIMEDVGLVTPVPLHFLRRMKRGYNQAEVLARGLMDGLGKTGIVAGDVLCRTRNTKTQTKLDREERQKNLAGAFTVGSRGGDAVKGKVVVLVDDVVTTGATTGFCAEALLAAGARGVRVLSFARG